MKFSTFTFILTEKCNFNCTYCYQKKGEKTLETSTIEKALHFFMPYLRDICYISFTGGEPLLAFEQIKQAVSYIQSRNKTEEKQIHYYLTTNGILINEEILDFLNQHKFSLMLSFDGIAQDIHRRKGSSKQIVEIIKKLPEFPNINFVINSVSTPESIGYLSKSIQFIIEIGVPDIILSLSINSSWNHSSLLQLKNELALLKNFIFLFYRRRGFIPLRCFRTKSSKGIFSCFGGFDRLTLTPDGKFWGCHLFPEYFREKEGTAEYKKYCFGDLEGLVDNHEKIFPEILANYSNLRMDYFYTDHDYCLQCSEIEECSVCPISAAFSSSIIGKIPNWTCHYRKIIRKENKIFWNEVESI